MKKINLFQNLGFRLVVEALLSVVFISALSFNAWAEGWEQDEKGWKYMYIDYDSPLPHYIKNDYRYIYDAGYAFDNDGYMVTGWWRYYDPESGYSNFWYYFNEDGKMRTEPLNEDGKTYYFDTEYRYCINPDGEPISQYGLAIRAIDTDPPCLIASITSYTELTSSRLQSHINALNTLTNDVNSLPKDIPSEDKVEHAYMLACIQRLNSKVELLRQIVANIESPNTDYQRLISQIEEYNGEKIGID